MRIYLPSIGFSSMSKMVVFVPGIGMVAHHRAAYYRDLGYTILDPEVGTQIHGEEFGRDTWREDADARSERESELLRAILARDAVRGMLSFNFAASEMHTQLFSCCRCENRHCWCHGRIVVSWAPVQAVA
jgi:hypothetical protein